MFTWGVEVWTRTIYGGIWVGIVRGTFIKGDGQEYIVLENGQGDTSFFPKSEVRNIRELYKRHA